MDTYEKKYKEALERAREELQKCGSLDCDCAKQMFRLFPELVESEDEMIRKELIGFLRNNPNGNYTCEEMAVWLEKQGGQKSTEWDEYDEMYVNALVAIVRKRGATDERLRDELIGWLSCLKCRLGE